MSDNHGQSKEAELQGELRRKLVKRLAMAGVLVAVLLGVLAFFDYLATPEEPEEPVTFNKPVPVPPKKEVTQPVMPASNLPEPPKQEEPPPPPPAPALAAATPAGETVESKAAAAPKTSGPVHALPAPTAAAAPHPAPARPVPLPREAAVVPESTAAPALQPVEEAPAPPRQPARVTDVVPRPAPSRLLSGYVLQAGVFTSAQRAEELHAKLTLNGIPSTMEARVQVGPFKSKAEAEAAREKLRGLGIESVLIPPAAKH